MNKYKDVKTETLIERYYELKRLVELLAFNSSQERRTRVSELCFVSSELIRRNIKLDEKLQ